MFWTRIATLGQLWDYTIYKCLYHDEIRESPTPGLFMGLMHVQVLVPLPLQHRQPQPVPRHRHPLRVDADGGGAMGVRCGSGQRVMGPHAL
jgi:hypothetical protein